MANKNNVKNQEIVTLESINMKLDAKLDALDAKFDAKFDAMDAKFDVMDAKFDMLDKKQDGFAADLRKQGVIMEQIESKVDLLAEGQVVLDKKIDGVDQKVDALKGEMDYKFEVVFEELHGVRTDISRLDKRVSVIEDTFVKQ
jgi:ABC-type phosphate transport system auxiliary subunit